jgi:hypothetical protein
MPWTGTDGRTDGRGFTTGEVTIAMLCESDVVLCRPNVARLFAFQQQSYDRRSTEMDAADTNHNHANTADGAAAVGGESCVDAGGGPTKKGRFTVQFSIGKPRQSSQAPPSPTETHFQYGMQFFIISNNLRVI